MRTVWAFVLLMSVPGCADLLLGTSEDDDSRKHPCWPDEPLVVDPSGVVSQYVVDSIEFPTSATQSQQLGIDLDCDQQGRPDNALGQIVSTLAASVDINLDSEIQALVDAGEILHLIQVQVTSFEDSASAGVVILHGEDTDDDSLDNFSGQERFAIDESRGAGFLSGRVDDGLLTAEHGVTPLAVTFPGLGEPFVVRLHGSRIELNETASGLSGKIAGAVIEDDVRSIVIPIFREGLQRIVNRDCDEGVCADGSSGEVLLNLFDTDIDGEITSEELSENALVNAFLSPDVDLFDENGDFNPRTDEFKDALSIGIGFTAVPASFAAQ